jgi:glycosyltransferase involved in cell wall biosynthesis
MKHRPVIADLIFQPEMMFDDYHQLMALQAPNSGHFQHLAQHSHLHVIRLINLKKTVVMNGVIYHFFKGKASKTWLPFKLIQFTRRLKPDLIILHGFSNPLQVLLLVIQTRVPVVIQYHGGGVPRGLRGRLQKIIRYFVKHYIFTAKAQGDSFIREGLMTPTSRIHEILEGSTYKRGIEKQQARTRLDIPLNKIVFLWVGRLIKNKDPLTVINGLKKFIHNNPNAELRMIYNDNTLLPEVRKTILQNEALKERVKLIGEVKHEEMEVFYSAADYYVSGSFEEGSGYALFESLACGCVPLVTDIPSFRAITDNGNIGVLWKPGDSASLELALDTLLKKSYEAESRKAKLFFKNELSFEAIARKYLDMAEQMMLKEK